MLDNVDFFIDKPVWIAMMVPVVTAVYGNRTQTWLGSIGPCGFSPTYRDRRRKNFHRRGLGDPGGRPMRIFLRNVLWACFVCLFVAICLAPLGAEEADTSLFEVESDAPGSSAIPADSASDDGDTESDGSMLDET